MPNNVIGPLLTVWTTQDRRAAIGRDAQFHHRLVELASAIASARERRPGRVTPPAPTKGGSVQIPACESRHLRSPPVSRARSRTAHVRNGTKKTAHRRPRQRGPPAWAHVCTEKTPRFQAGAGVAGRCARGCGPSRAHLPAGRSGPATYPATAICHRRGHSENTPAVLLATVFEFNARGCSTVATHPAKTLMICTFLLIGCTASLANSPRI